LNKFYKFWTAAEMSVLVPFKSELSADPLLLYLLWVFMSQMHPSYHQI